MEKWTHCVATKLNSQRFVRLQFLFLAVAHLRPTSYLHLNIRHSNCNCISLVFIYLDDSFSASSAPERANFLAVFHLNCMQRLCHDMTAA